MEFSSAHDMLASEKLSFDRFRFAVLNDYRLVCESREISLLGRKEVLTGKAKFGIFGDGKEVAQVALSKFFQPGDFLSGYYRDQTIAFATGAATGEEFFSQLYADPNQENDPHSSGRQMNAHFATPLMGDDGQWLDQVNRKNISSGMAPTAAQVPRSLGLALASKLYRQEPALHQYEHLSNNGNEICFCTIGDASTSEGHFWEAVNAAGVMQIPVAFFVWDDGFGISVPTNLQTTKGSISEAMKGLKKTDTSNGIDIYKVKAWDYAGMCEVFEAAFQKIRDTHIPALFHVEEVTQPQGHSTSGSHERYKSPERLAWEKEWDANKKMREWILENDLSNEEELSEIEYESKEWARQCKNNAWEKFFKPIKELLAETMAHLDALAATTEDESGRLAQAREKLRSNREPYRKDMITALHAAMEVAPPSRELQMARHFYERLKNQGYQTYGTHLYSEAPNSPLMVQGNEAQFDEDSPSMNGYEILNRYFDQLIGSNEKVVAFGEDLGKIGDVNQGFAGLQAKHGEHRIFDTGIRELSIIGQGIGLAMRGLRPIAEIQYIDYLLYGLQPLSDDAASLHWRSKGRQSAPLIVRTRGHRLEGIWHSGSPMSLMLSALRGMHVCVPRNMVQAVGLYNTLLGGNDPGIMVECLNGYRLKEKLPVNLLDYKVPLGVPEVVREGEDITLVSYGSTLRIVQEAAETLALAGISCEVVDVQTLLPFDRPHKIVESLHKTNRILFIDEDLPGGATAYMYNHVMEVQKGFRWLDVAPRTISAQAHRPGYGSDGDYFSKPNAEQIVDTVKEMMSE
jgi:pyruvate/2-oxoglutarate/acetoin dehydrogenase E1 component/TPP-dependent pyruvate/acetoin dehydrogenase alpha subunit